MNPRLLMIASALVLGVTGIAASFAPQEILSTLGVAPVSPLPVLVQLLGALLFGFAMLNWLARETLIGGVYGRPVTVGNLSHFAIGALALLRGLAAGASPVLWGVTAVYTVFALGFGWVLFRHPSPKASASS
jgi:hypothetical protein